MGTRFPPFYGESVPELFEQIMKCQYDWPNEHTDHVPEAARDVVESMLAPRMGRLNACQVLQLPWFVTLSSSSKCFGPAWTEKLTKTVEHLHSNWRHFPDAALVGDTVMIAKKINAAIL